jgi:hypothetical protein
VRREHDAVARGDAEECDEADTNTAIFSIINAALLRSLPFTEAEWLVMIWQTHQDIPRAEPAFPDFADAPFKNAVVQIGCGKFVAKLFVRVLENSQISGLHGSEILG